MDDSITVAIMIYTIGVFFLIFLSIAISFDRRIKKIEKQLKDITEIKEELEEYGDLLSFLVKKDGLKLVDECGHGEYINIDKKYDNMF